LGLEEYVHISEGRGVVSGKDKKTVPKKEPNRVLQMYALQGLYIVTSNAPRGRRGIRKVEDSPQRCENPGELKEKNLRKTAVKEGGTFHSNRRSIEVAREKSLQEESFQGEKNGREEEKFHLP